MITKLKLSIRNGDSKNLTGIYGGYVATLVGSSMTSELKNAEKQIRVPVIAKRVHELWKTLHYESDERKSKDYLRSLAKSDTTPLNRLERGWLLQLLLDSLFDFGPLSILMRSPEVTEIQVFSCGLMQVKTTNNFWQRTNARFEDREHIIEIVSRKLKVERVELESGKVIEKCIPDGFWIAANFHNDIVLFVVRTEKKRTSAEAEVRS